MTDYLPAYVPGKTLNATAAAAITGGQVVAVTGATGLVPTVGPAAANSTKAIGVAAFDAAIGETVAIYTGGVQEVTVGGATAVVAGDQIIAAAAGTVTPSATPPTGTKLGIALTSAAVGARVRVQFER